MSLSMVIADPLVRRRLDLFIPDVSRKIEAKMLVPPRSADCRIIGGAFDYALRMKLVRAGGRVRHGPWVAEMSAAALFWKYAYASSLDSSAFWDPLARKSLRVVQEARRFMESASSSSGSVDEETAFHALRLARLDQEYRAGYSDGKFDRASRAEISEVVALLDVTPFDRFRHRRAVVCNPVLDMKGRVVGGADADLVVGDRLVELKTVNRSSVDISWVRQLVGYLVLARHPSASGAEPLSIRTLEIYSSRHAAFWSIQVDDVVRQRGFAAFEQWFLQNGQSAMKRAIRKRVTQAAAA